MFDQVYKEEAFSEGDLRRIEAHDVFGALSRLVRCVARVVVASGKQEQQAAILGAFEEAFSSAAELIEKDGDVSPKERHRSLDEDLVSKEELITRAFTLLGCCGRAESILGAAKIIQRVCQDQLSGQALRAGELCLQHPVVKVVMAIYRIGSVYPHFRQTIDKCQVLRAVCASPAPVSTLKKRLNRPGQSRLLAREVSWVLVMTSVRFSRLLLLAG